MWVPISGNAPSITSVAIINGMVLVKYHHPRNDQPASIVVLPTPAHHAMRQAYRAVLADPRTVALLNDLKETMGIY